MGGFGGRKTKLCCASRKTRPQVGVGFARRLADIKAAEKYEREVAVEAHAAQAQAEVSECLMPVRSFSEVEEFLNLFQNGQHLLRRPMLAIVGGTNLGKSLLAASVLRRLSSLLGVCGFLEVTVEGNQHLDLTGTSWHRWHTLDVFRNVRTLQI